MTHPEPERLALELQRLIERRDALRAIVGQRALKNALTAREQADIRRVIDILDTERVALEERLDALRKRLGKAPG